MKKHYLLLFALPLVLACGSIDLEGLGGLADILGSTGPEDQSDVRGTITTIDTAARRIDLDVDFVNNLRDSRADSSIYYDDNTVVEYQGDTYAPIDLERGDVIEVIGTASNGMYTARTIRVVRNVRD